MDFTLTIPHASGMPLELTLAQGETLFILGANGTGKSTLMHRFYVAHHDVAERVTAHRQTWFSTNTINFSPAQRRQTGTQIHGRDRSPESRWVDHHASERANLAIYDLVDAENVRARSITDAVDKKDLAHAQVLAKKDSSIRTINELLRLSGIQIEISIHKNEEIVATKAGGKPYSIAQLSDGERNALLLAADVLTARDGSLLLIDEPERHLHRSIISPLLTVLFARRPDCAFVVSTHEVMLPIDNSMARTLLVRDCSYANASSPTWDADLVASGIVIDDDIMRDILGARRTVLFVEGGERSLDKPLYSLVFPSASVVAKASCRDVEHAVSGIRDAADLHWIRAYGIVDGDRRTAGDLERLREKGVYAISAFSIESVYYHPEIQRCVAERQAEVIGDDAGARLLGAKNAALAALRPHVQRLSERTAEKQLREEFLQHLPQRKNVSAGAPLNVSIDVAGEVLRERLRLERALDDGDLAVLIAQYPVRETQALAEIASKLGFQNRQQYEGAVRKLLLDNADVIKFVRSLFGTLAFDMGIT